jgi:DNA-binding LacI/PurR family transcriptional regulator
MKRATFSSSPKYMQLAQHFRDLIRENKLKPGDRLPSFTALRAELGVGQSTLERAHTLLEEESLIVREPGRGIFVAQPTQRPQLNVIGVTGISSMKGQHPYYALLLNGIQQKAHEHEIEILLLHDNSAIHWEKVDGVLVYYWHPEEMLERMPPGMPCVSLLYPSFEIPSVTVNDYSGMKAATEHLLSLGHRRIAYLRVLQDDIPTRQRLSGYQDALRGAGLEPQDDWLHLLRDDEVADDETIYASFAKWGYQKMRQWLENGWRDLGCTALLAQNDDTAIGAIKALEEAGFSVPGDVSVVGFDNTQAAAHFRPRLTTVNVPLREIGKRAVEELLLLSDQEEKHELQGLPRSLSAELVIGESTAVAGEKND